MFARTVWSDDVLAETINDLICNFNLTSLKTLGTETKGGAGNHQTLSERMWERRRFNGSFSLCKSMIE